MSRKLLISDMNDMVEKLWSEKSIDDLQESHPSLHSALEKAEDALRDAKNELFDYRQDQEVAAELEAVVIDKDDNCQECGLPIGASQTSKLKDICDECYGEDEIENPTSQGPHNDSSWDYHYG